MQHSGKFIALYRVSTGQQGRSGLGLDGQREAVLSYLNGGNWSLIAEFTEIESGTKKGDRRVLDQAVARCQMTGATLVIAKFDRLTRDLSTLCRLRDANVRFVAADNPSATNLTVSILISVAEEEARLISERTKAALAATKARGTVLGGYRGGPVPDAASGGAARAAQAEAFAALVGPVVQQYRSEGLSLRQIAAKLTEDGIETASKHGTWTAAAVKVVLDRLAK